MANSAIDSHCSVPRRRFKAQAFADWVVSPAGQQTVAAYKIGGEQLFFPNAAAK